MVLPPEKPIHPSESNSAASQAKAWAIGLNFVYGVIGFGVIGWALERWVWPGASPWLLLGGLGLGLVSSFYRFIREALEMGRKPDPAKRPVSGADDEPR